VSRLYIIAQFACARCKFRWQATLDPAPIHLGKWQYGTHCPQCSHFTNPHTCEKETWPDA
jgi:hypothetical protein